jgi:hypothetical protein
MKGASYPFFGAKTIWYLLSGGHVRVVTAAIPGVPLTVRSNKRVTSSYMNNIMARLGTDRLWLPARIFYPWPPGYAWVIGSARDDANAKRLGVDWVSVAPQLASASPRLEVL